MIFAIFTSVASLASIIGLAYQLYKHKEKPFTYILLSISLFSSIISAVLWFSLTTVELENNKLKTARYQAEELYKTWPITEDFKFVSSGEFRGIVLSGMAFLESNREVFPETYETTKHLMLKELKVESNDEKENFISKREKLQEAAETMIVTIKAIRIQYKP